jgi:hypothetical protein
MTGKFNVVDYKDPVNDKCTAYQGYSMEFNTYWIKIYKLERGTGRHTDEVVAVRTPDMNEWLDAKHKKIADAIANLDKAILEMIKGEGN